MISPAIMSGRVSWRARAPDRLIAVVFLCAAIIGAMSAVGLPTRSNSASLTVMLPPQGSAALVEATSAPAAADLQAVGEQAVKLNAALPFARDPLHSARPFALQGSDSDQRRALLCLTQAVYYEAGFEPMDGRRAVAQVVLNRLRHPAFPKSICGVVYQRSNGRVCQFTFVCDGALYRAPSRRQWLEAEAIAREALSGFVDSSVGEATHYHADYVGPRWAPLLAKVAQIGQHIFYRWPGSWGQPSAFVGRYIGEPRDPLSLRPPAVEASNGSPVAVLGAATAAGPAVARAPSDIGGLLDTSKGWTLDIPAPGDDASSAAKLIAAQERGGARPVHAMPAPVQTAAR